VSKSPVGFRHAVGVLTSRDCLALIAGGIPEFLRQAKVDWLASFFANGGDDPPECQRLLATAIELHRNLVVRTTDSLGTNFDLRADVIQSLVEEIDRLFWRFGVVFFLNLRSTSSNAL
jgi:hypothetical protein